jgi:hypothetical protein
VTSGAITIVVQRTLPSQNVRDRWHWRTRHADRDAWRLLLRAAVRSLPRRPDGRMHVTITSLRQALIQDDANLRGGAKGLVDALVGLGFIRDDSSRYVHIDYHQKRVPRALQCTRIVVRPEGA